MLIVVTLEVSLLGCDALTFIT